jgi:hypothetical protein
MLHAVIWPFVSDSGILSERKTRVRCYYEPVPTIVTSVELAYVWNIFIAPGTEAKLIACMWYLFSRTEPKFYCYFNRNPTEYAIQRILFRIHTWLQ